jgi:hypothetical protein
VSDQPTLDGRRPEGGRERGNGVARAGFDQRKGGQPMRKRTVWGVVLALALTAVVGGVSKAAAPKDYQFTGTVTEIDAKSKTISVDKAGDVWEFSTSGRDLAKDLTKVKKGDKITVRYYMVVKAIESK